MADFGPEGINDFPPMPHVHHDLIHQMIGTSLAPLRCIKTDDFNPLEEQWALAPGDYAVPLLADGPIEDDLAVVKILAPEQYKDQFPDWDKRYIRRWILCEWTSHHNHEREPEATWHLGWFERGRLIPCDEAQAMELRDAIVAAGVDHEGQIEPPDWLAQKYNSIGVRLDWLNSKPSPTYSGDDDRVACGKCGSQENVQLHGTATVHLSGWPKAVEEDGKTVYYTRDNPSAEKDMKFHLHCVVCGARKELEPDEWHVHGPSPM